MGDDRDFPAAAREALKQGEGKADVFPGRKDDGADRASRSPQNAKPPVGAETPHRHLQRGQRPPRKLVNIGEAEEIHVELVHQVGVLDTRMPTITDLTF